MIYYFFSSELKAIQNHRKFEKKINHNVIPSYFQRGYITAPFSIWSNVYKLFPGSYLEFSKHNINTFPEPTKYWEIEKIAYESSNINLKSSEEDVVTHVEDLLSKTVRYQNQADVQIGAFLSGYSLIPQQ